MLVVGAGGLGAPVLMYPPPGWARSGSSTTTSWICRTPAPDRARHRRRGLYKVAPPESLAHINPGVAVETFETRLDAESAPDLFGGWDLIVDGSDNFPTRYAVNDAAIRAGKTDVGCHPPLGAGDHDPRRRRLQALLALLFPEAPPRNSSPAARRRVPCRRRLPPGSEALKELLGLGEPLAGRLLLYDALSVTLQRSTTRKPRVQGVRRG